MKQLAVISYKGGTGKTAITVAFASLADNFVLADCDVNAPDLHLFLKADIKKTVGFHDLKIASVDDEKCDDCKKCINFCRFNAIDEKINIIPKSCEGCSICEYVCPVDAIKMIDRDSSLIYASETHFGPISHARFNPGEKISGKLVTAVKENAKTIAEEKRKNLVIIDGPSGISYPAFSTIIDVDLVLIVTEPSLSAVLDLERMIGITNHFKIPAVVCINKYDLNIQITEGIEEYCKNHDIELVGKLPFDTVMTEAMVKEKSIIEFSDGELSNRIIEMWNATVEKLLI